MHAHHIFLWLRPNIQQIKKVETLHIDGASKVHGKERVEVTVKCCDLGVGLANGLELFQETNLLEKRRQVGS